MIEVRTERGVHLPEIDLWLDPQGPRDRAFVSHAHSDHTGRHREAILTAGTSRLMRERLGVAKGREHILGWREHLRFPDFEVELLPAGHVLGSAQCLVTTEAGTLLQTGDFKLRASFCAEPIAPARADVLVMETTFGLPRYVFPPDDEVLAGVARFCVETLDTGATPVLLAYSLGKAQEILAALATTALPVCLHEAVWKMTRAYEELGATFPAYALCEDAPPAGSVLICPPNARTLLERIPRRRVAVLSGWAMDPHTIHRMRADAAFPLSDHAGYDDLMRYVELVQPRRVLTHHGFAREFASDLRRRGIEAWSLGGVDQLELILD
jgi:Cft2 family RNA processing exonuclease